MEQLSVSLREKSFEEKPPIFKQKIKEVAKEANQRSSKANMQFLECNRGSKKLE